MLVPVVECTQVVDNLVVLAGCIAVVVEPVEDSFEAVVGRLVDRSVVGGTEVLVGAVQPADIAVVQTVVERVRH